jgi:hypothetical protein
MSFACFRYLIADKEMASRNGLMPLGTDGTDFMHRETVANQYKIR